MKNELLRAIEATDLVRRLGRVTQFFGQVIESNGPDVFVGECCEIFSPNNDDPVLAEVVGIKNNHVLLLPYGEVKAIRLGSQVIASGRAMSVPVGRELLGRVVGAFGTPLDDKGEIKSNCRYPLFTTPVNPLKRQRIDEILETGIKTIDTLLTIGKGQRMGIFSGSGVGKTTLLGMIARNMSADVNVIALIGERGREVLEFIEKSLGAKGLNRSVIVVATSDQPALIRSHAALTATAIAEYFRDQGKDVLLTMDSVTRFAMAQREIGLAVGEPPTSRGYTPSVFAMLPRMLERSGATESGGSITSLYTVLVEGDDINDPIADSLRAILDGHIILSREHANSAHFPAIDILNSVSRLANDLMDKDHLSLAKKLIKIVGKYEGSRDMVELGAYTKGSNHELDEILSLMPEISRYLQQNINEKYKRSDSIRILSRLLSNIDI
ncbi:MAG: FliI/YscN family ATPase [Candidatus Thiodiazotropha sp. (ex Dulcina madagascariensis)]|nr:FliI/YscN family ATPase [Candidatus Thiodiazotropha sp. (ex Dulcina madagascariensis)]